MRKITSFLNSVTTVLLAIILIPQFSFAAYIDSETVDARDIRCVTNVGSVNCNGSRTMTGDYHVACNAWIRALTNRGENLTLPVVSGRYLGTRDHNLIFVGIGGAWISDSIARSRLKSYIKNDVKSFANSFPNCNR